MPRSGRGGKRTGTPGKSYTNRSDLNDKAQPITVPTGLGYGERKMAEEAQRAAPLAGAPAPPTAGAPAAPPPYSGPPLTPLNAPSELPNQPVQAGLSLGPGGGPELLGLDQNADLQKLAAYLPTLEVLASRPGTSEDMRNLVRMVRANVPTGGGA